MKLTLTTAALAAALFTVQPTFGQNEPQRTPPAAAGANDAQPAAAAHPGDRADSQAMNMDQKFVREAASGNQLEIQLGQLAQQRAQSDAVKQLGQQLTKDHQQAQQMLEKAAQAKNIQVPQELTPEHQACLQKFQKLQGKEFDKHFLAGQTGDHVKDILMYRDAEKDLQDPQLKQYVQQTLPHLEQHFQSLAQAAGWSGEARTAGSHEAGSHDANRTGSGTDRTGAGSSDRTPGSTPGSGTGTSGGTGGSTGTGTGTSGTGTSGTNR